MKLNIATHQVTVHGKLRNMRLRWFTIEPFVCVSKGTTWQADPNEVTPVFCYRYHLATKIGNLSLLSAMAKPSYYRA